MLRKFAIRWALQTKRVGGGGGGGDSGGAGVGSRGVGGGGGGGAWWLNFKIWVYRRKPKTTSWFF